MYFSILPNLYYDKKPQSFPFSSADFIVVKNFFKRYQIHKDVFNHTVFYNKYAIENDLRIEQIAEKVYNDVNLDWVIALTNNITNVHKDWPLSNYSLQKWLNDSYENPESIIKYYEITEDVKNDSGTVFLKKGQKVDKTFHEGNFQYNNEDTNNSISTIPGNTISSPISLFDDEFRKNEAKREIYILKSQWVKPLVDDLKKQRTYKKCSAFISSKLKETLV